VVACALERCWLADGQYPESLEALVPRFIDQLPPDVINSQPLHYRRTEDPRSQSSGAASSRFVLYSVGWNETDDGGTPGNTQFDEKQGDWVWRYPSN